jgi:hypothetical protein
MRLARAILDRLSRRSKTLPLLTQTLENRRARQVRLMALWASTDSLSLYLRPPSPAALTTPAIGLGLQIVLVQ